LGLNELYGARLSLPELARLGEQIASDVPFFLFGGAAIIRGRGERVVPIVPRTDFGLLIVQPPWTSSTPEAYEALDSLRNNAGGLHQYCFETQVAPYLSHLSDDELVRRYRLPIAQWPFMNDFQPVLEKRYPEYRKWYSILRDYGAEYVSLTGSGSCFFGVFDSLDKAKEASEQCRDNIAKMDAGYLSLPVNIFVVQPLARSIKVSYSQSCNEDTRPDKERPCYGSH